MRTADAPLKARIRAGRPRRDRIALSIPRSTLHLLAGAGFVALALAFAAGWWLGRGSRGDAPQPASTTRVVLAPRNEKREPPAPVEEAPPPRPVESASPPPATGAPPPPAALPPPPPAPPPLEIFDEAPRGRHGIQVGAFPEREEAMDFIEANAEPLAGLPVHVISTKLRGRGTWYRVRVGRFPSKKAAESARLALPPDLTKSSMVVRYR